MNNKKLKILDCTLRDGGYYNNWNFSAKLTNSYLKSISKTNIEFIEIGFKSNIEDKKIGPTGKIDDTFLKSINVPDNIKLGIMINSNEIIDRKNSKSSSIEKYFSNYSIRKLSFVRLATHIKDLFKLGDTIKWLKKNNFLVAVNIMQISEIKKNKIKSYCNFFNRKNIDVLYLADSLGSLNQKEIKKNFIEFNKHFNNELGIHAHDNLSLALNNSKTAYKNGATWIDSTITGMGRGPGNVKTENLLRTVINNKLFPKDYKKLENSIIKKFLSLKKRYKWGTNKFYEFSGKKEIHPTYIQILLNNKDFSKKMIFKIISGLSKLNVKKFNPLNFHYVDNFIRDNKLMYTNPKKFLKKSKLLIIGPGKSISNKKNKIKNFINKNDCDVIYINKVKNFFKLKFFFRVVCHPLKLISDFNFHKKNKDILILPTNNLSKKNFIEIKKTKKKLLNYGMKLGAINNVKINNNSCILPIPLTIAYAISLGFAGNAKKLYLAGFDGREKDDPYDDSTQKIIKLFKNKYRNKKLSSITKTNYLF